MIYAIIQARMGSSRLPNKVLLNLKGHTVLEHVITRINQSKYIDNIFVATSNKPENKDIKKLCNDLNVSCFMGSEEDVLDRFYQLAKLNNFQDDDILIRITADCPLIDPLVVDKVIIEHLSKNNDYTSNTIECTYPDGLDCEVFNFKILKDIWKNAKLNSEREHVTLYIHNNSKSYKLNNVANDIDLSHLRWTLDEKEDYIFINEIYKYLFNENEIFLTKDILRLLENKVNLKNINNKYVRNEGLLKSLNKEKLVGKEKNVKK